MLWAALAWRNAEVKTVKWTQQRKVRERMLQAVKKEAEAMLQHVRKGANVTEGSLKDTSQRPAVEAEADSWGTSTES